MRSWVDRNQGIHYRVRRFETRQKLTPRFFNVDTAFHRNPSNVVSVQGRVVAAYNAFKKPVTTVAFPQFRLRRVQRIEQITLTLCIAVRIFGYESESLFFLLACT